MNFTVESPTYDTINKFYTLKIESPPAFIQEGPADMSGMTFDGPLREQFDEFVSEFLLKASSYFSKPLERAVFLERVAHSYSTGDYEGTDVSLGKLTWIPARILFYPSRYEIRWILTAIEPLAPAPGTMIQETEIEAVSFEDPPRRMLPPESVQKRTRKKIRETRIRLAFAKLHLEQMTEKYYVKYGHFDGLGVADSELSSEGE